jgi:hypothetical protein
MLSQLQLLQFNFLLFIVIQYLNITAMAGKAHTSLNGKFKINYKRRKKALIKDKQCSRNPSVSSAKSP